MTTIILQNNGIRNIELPGGQVFAKGKTMKFPKEQAERLQRMYFREVKSLEDLTATFEAAIPENAVEVPAEEVVTEEKAPADEVPAEEVKESTKKVRAKNANVDTAGDIEAASNDLSLDTI